MKIVGIIWLDEIVEKLHRKHAVEPEEVEEALVNDPYFFFAEKGVRTSMVLLDGRMAVGIWSSTSSSSKIEAR